jgi:hypothetical protein
VGIKNNIMKELSLSWAKIMLFISRLVIFDWNRIVLHGFFANLKDAVPGFHLYASDAHAPNVGWSR